MTIPDTETFNGTFPFAPPVFDGHGFRQHYVDEGPRGGEAIIFLHGEPTWGYLYRNFIPKLSERYRVIVPDHMGFGKSETPPDRVYTLQTHVENLENLIEYLGTDDITFVGQDWGGPMTGAYTLRNPQRVKRLVLMNTLLGYGGVQPERLSPWFAWITKHHEQGTLDGILGELGSTVLSVMKIPGFQNSAVVTDDWLRAYATPFPDRTSCAGAIAFPLDVVLGKARPFVTQCLKQGDIMALRAKPAMLAYGMADQAIVPDYGIADFEALFPEAPVVRLPGVGHYCQEDAPAVLVALIEQFMQVS